MSRPRGSSTTRRWSSPTRRPPPLGRGSGTPSCAGARAPPRAPWARAGYPSSGCGGLTEGQEGGCVRHGGGGPLFRGQNVTPANLIFCLLQLLALLHVRVSKCHSWRSSTALSTSTGPLSPNSSTASRTSAKACASSGESLDGLTEKREGGWREDKCLFIYVFIYLTYSRATSSRGRSGHQPGWW